jgi:hypothetical protein
MDQRYDDSQWVAAYLEWTGADRDGLDAARTDAAPAAGGEDQMQFVHAYLDWMDARRTVAAPRREPRAAAPQRPGREAEVRGTRREAILLAALRTQSDCIRVLRRALDGGHAPPPHAVGLAYEAIEFAELLLKDERLRSVRV